MNKQNKTIGLIGGMGPFASAYFYKLLLSKSLGDYGAKNNDDFPEILIDSVPVPDFVSDTSKLKKAKTMLISRVKKMNRYGVGSIGMICNTGHILYDDLSKISKGKFYSMIDLVAEEASNKGFRKIGVLATSTTIKFDLYGKALFKKGIKVFYPKVGSQKLHESIIRDMIAGKKVSGDVKKLEISVEKLIREYGLDGVILGCTELPLVFPKNKFENVIDCLDILADKLLERYYN
jgi:aspartate racemase